MVQVHAHSIHIHTSHGWEWDSTLKRDHCGSVHLALVNNGWWWFVWWRSDPTNPKVDAFDLFYERYHQGCRFPITAN